MWQMYTLNREDQGAKFFSKKSDTFRVSKGL